MRPYVHAAHAFIVPLLVGGGTRIKAFEAMAMGSLWCRLRLASKDWMPRTVGIIRDAAMPQRFLIWSVILPCVTACPGPHANWSKSASVFA